MEPKFKVGDSVVCIISPENISILGHQGVVVRVGSYRMQGQQTYNVQYEASLKSPVMMLESEIEKS